MYLVLRWKPLAIGVEIPGFGYFAGGDAVGDELEGVHFVTLQRMGKLKLTTLPRVYCVSDSLGLGGRSNGAADGAAVGTVVRVAVACGCRGHLRTHECVEQARLLPIAIQYRAGGHVDRQRESV